MQLEAKKLLEDIRPRSFLSEDRSGGVERQFEIIGEALNRLVKTTPDTAGQISHHKRVISFRNILIHGYDLVEDAVVWDVVAKDLPLLHSQVAKLLGNAH
jgi:uncharacterized protein with HEPN domain